MSTSTLILLEGKATEVKCSSRINGQQHPTKMKSHRITHRITEWSGLEGTSVGHPVQPPAEAGLPTAGCRGPCPGGA